jgi:hypothetical protein
MDATDHQTLCGAWVERKPTANLMPITCQQAVMDNASERIAEPSLSRTGLRRFYGLVQKDKDRGWRLSIRPVFTPTKPGG